MNRLIQDLRYVLRSLTREKTFWVVSLLTLALCTGAKHSDLQPHQRRPATAASLPRTGTAGDGLQHVSEG